MTQIDTKFLKVHPRTALWWKQRSTCEKCKFSDIRAITRTSGGGWQCTKNRNQAAWYSCINARDVGEPCGPDAMQFWPKQKETA
jgi:hypothetical protein